jgi:uncharacterized protein
MKTVSYVTRRNVLSRGAMGAVGGLFFARSRWADATDLPLVRRITLTHPELPAAFSGLRIAQISDVHAGVFMPPQRLARVRELVEDAAPDLLAFTGDQLDRREVDAEMFVHGFAGIHAPLGAYGILGNHDHHAGRDLAVAALEAVGITPLVNTAATIERGGSRLRVVGVDDLNAWPPHGPSFRVVGEDEGLFRLLLCHQPSGFRAARNAGAHVMLAGHTHGGQITFPSRAVNVARLQTAYIAGPYLRGEHLLYVSRGIGVGAVPLRFGAPPELDLITLERGPLGWDAG